MSFASRIPALVLPVAAAVAAIALTGCSSSGAPAAAPAPSSGSPSVSSTPAPAVTTVTATATPPQSSPAPTSSSTRETVTEVPTLGQPFSPSQVGVGTVRPKTVYNGGDGSGMFTGITWTSWGGATADGRGKAEWIGPDAKSAADGTIESADFRAYDLGSCHGKPAYLHLAVWFPQHGEHFSESDPETQYLLCPAS